MRERDNATFLIKSTKGRAFGTSFCVHKDSRGSLLLTCAHVVESCGCEDLEVESLKATLLHISDDDTIDLALVYVEGLTDSSVLKLFDEPAIEGEAFEILGYRPHKRNYAKEPLKGYIKKSYTLQSDDNKRVMCELSLFEGDSIEQGYSGSAVVCTETGFVIAVATDRKRDGRNAYATPIGYLKEIWSEIPRKLLLKASDMENPYKGLRSFEYKDRENYYGREIESQEIADRLQNTRLFSLLGASGSGKSSLIFAGVLPLIEGEGVEILNFRPLSEPFQNLSSLFIPTIYPDIMEQIEQEEILSNKLMNKDLKLESVVEVFLKKRGSERLYLIVDQFEELFTLTKESKVRNAFLDQLLTLIESDLDLSLIICMRADFLSQLSYYAPFSAVYDKYESRILTLLNRQSLRSVIQEPALKLGVTFQDGLVKRIIDEVENEAGQLPLLEFALEQLWSKKKGRVIRHEILDEMKSISHSISHYADNVYQQYPEKQASIKRILIKLVNPGSGTEDSRRIAMMSEFNEEDRETIQLLANKRLIVTRGEEYIDIVHEALILEWKRLQGWIDGYREFLEWEKRLREDRKIYLKYMAKNHKINLLTGNKLLNAQEFLRNHAPYISPIDKKFIQKSIYIFDERRKKRRVVWAFVVVLTLGFMGIIFALWVKADRERVRAEELTLKLGKVVGDYFYSTMSSSKEKKSNDLKTYHLIINEFKNAKDADIIKVVGYSYQKLGNYPKAIEKYQKIENISQGDYGFLISMGESYFRVNNLDKAIASYQKAIEVDPTKEHAHFNMGYTYRMSKQYDHAIEKFYDVIEINPTSYRAYFHLGFAYYSCGSYEKSMVALQKAIGLKPKELQTYIKLFKVQIEQQSLFRSKRKERKFLAIRRNRLRLYDLLSILKSGDNYFEFRLQYPEFNAKIGLSIIKQLTNKIRDKEVKHELLERLGKFRSILSNEIE